MGQLSKLTRRRWSKEEDDKLLRQFNAGNQNWKSVASNLGLDRKSGSFRLRYLNHLKPRNCPKKFTVEEELLTLELRSRWGDKNLWAKTAKKLLPGRTDNEVKNFWHTFKNKANREGGEENSEAILKKRAELVEMIKDRGRFTMDYSSLPSDTYDLLRELFPDIAGGADIEAADTDGGFDVGTPAGRVGHTFFPQSDVDETPQSHVAVERQFFPTGFSRYGGDPGAAPGSVPVSAADPRKFFSIAPLFYMPVHPLVTTGLFHRPTGFNLVPAALGIAFTETGTRQVTIPKYSGPLYNTFDVAQQYHALVEQQGLNGGCLDHGGGAIGLNEAMAAVALVTSPEYSDPLYNTSGVVQQYHAPVEQQGLNGGCLDHGGGPIGLNKAMTTLVTNSDSVPVLTTFNDAPGEQHQQLGFTGEDLYLGGGPAEFNHAAAFHNIRRSYFY